MTLWSNGNRDLARLEAVREQVRGLARKHEWLADAMRRSLLDIVKLNRRFSAEQGAMHDRERGLACEIMAAGSLFDPKCRDNRPCLFVRVAGLCPAGLAARLGRYGDAEAMPEPLQRQGAKAALAALHRQDEYRGRMPSTPEWEAMAASDRAAIAAGTHVEFLWTIVLGRPQDCRCPPIRIRLTVRTCNGSQKPTTVRLRSIAWGDWPTPARCGQSSLSR